MRSLYDRYTEPPKLLCCDYDLFDNDEFMGFHKIAFSYANAENFQCPHLFDNWCYQVPYNLVYYLDII